MEWAESIAKNAQITLRNVELKQLITELADAYSFHTFEDDPLLQSAREVCQNEHSVVKTQ
jgi:hypothetical protein